MATTRVRQKVLALLFLLSIITYLDRVCISVAAPAMSRDLGLSPSQLGLIFSAFSLAYSLFEIPGGWMADRFGPRRVLTRIVLWWSIFTAWTGAVSSYGQLLTVRFLFGAGEAGAYPGSASVIARWFPLVERARAHGLVWMASSLGGALSPLLVVPLQAAFGWRSVFYIFSVLGVIWAVVWHRWFRDDPQTQPGVSGEELHWIGSAKRVAAHLPSRSVFRSRNLWAVMTMYHFYCYGAYWFLTWTPTYLTEAKGMRGGTLAAFAALPFLLGAVANLAGGWAGDRLVSRIGLKWGRRAIGMGGMCLASTMVLASLAIKDRGWAAAVLMLAFAGSSFMLPTCWAVCLDIGRESAGLVSGSMNMAGQVGSTIVAYAFGRMVESYGWDLPLIGLSVCSLLAAVLWLRIDPTQPIAAPSPSQ